MKRRLNGGRWLRKNVGKTIGFFTWKSVLTLGQNDTSQYNTTLSQKNCRKGGSTLNADNSEALRAEVIATKKTNLRVSKRSDVVANGGKGGQVRQLSIVCREHRGTGLTAGGWRRITTQRNCFTSMWGKSKTRPGSGGWCATMAKR